MDAAVTLRPCMQMLTPRRSAPTGSGGRCTGPSVPGAPQGPVPWSRRWAAVAAGVSPPEGAAARKRRLAARRTSAEAVSSVGSRKRSKSSPGASAPEARVHPVPSEIRLEMAAPAAKGAAAYSAPAVSSTNARDGSAIRNEESYASWWAASAMPP